MTPHEWHVLASFGLLTGALALIDGRSALLMIGVATLVVTVKNSKKITEVLV